MTDCGYYFITLGKAALPGGSGMRCEEPWRGSLASTSSFSCWTTNLLIISLVDGIRWCSGRTFLLYIYSPAWPAADKRPLSVMLPPSPGTAEMGCLWWTAETDVGQMSQLIFHMSFFTLTLHQSVSSPEASICLRALVSFSCFFMYLLELQQIFRNLKTFWPRTMMFFQ